MHCLQRSALKGVASIFGAVCFVLVDTVTVVGAFHLVPIVTTADIFYPVLVETAAVVAFG